MQEGTIGSQMPVSPSTSLLCENPRLAIEVCTTLNPATLLPVQNGEPRHDYVEVLGSVDSSRPYLSDQAIRDPDRELHADGSSSTNSPGERQAEDAVVTLTETVEAQPLPPGASAQLAELTQALELSEGQRANSVTDSRFFFLTLQVHGVKIHKERGLLTAGGQDLKNPGEILQLLEEVWKPRHVAGAHCRAHQEGGTVEARGNAGAHAGARRASTRPCHEAPITPLIPWAPDLAPMYSDAGQKWVRKEGARELKDGWAQMPGSRTVIPHL